MQRFSVPDMHCDQCKAKIEDALLDADGAAELVFDVDARELQVLSVLAPAEVHDVLATVGYPATIVG